MAPRTKRNSCWILCLGFRDSVCKYDAWSELNTLKTIQDGRVNELICWIRCFRSESENTVNLVHDWRKILHQSCLFFFFQYINVIYHNSLSPRIIIFNWCEPTATGPLTTVLQSVHWRHTLYNLGGVSANRLTSELTNQHEETRV